MKQAFDLSKYRYLICDLDGTLLDTIEDICFAMNEALEETGYPYRYDRNTTRALIGDGADNAVRRALRERGNNEEDFARLRPVYLRRYAQYQTAHAKPYPGLVDALSALKRKGVKLYCLTNKPHALAEEVLALNYGKGFFDDILGAQDDLPVKPDPSGTLRLMERNGIPTEEACFIGDSHVDIATAHNAGLPCLLVQWGYELDYPTYISQAEASIKEPSELLTDTRL